MIIYFLEDGDYMLLDYLVKNYEKGEPIFLADISIEGMSEENIRYHLKKLTDAGVICRFEAGIYYLPKKNIFGENSVISAETYFKTREKSRFLFRIYVGKSTWFINADAI